MIHFFPFYREVPMELIRESRGREVHLQMEDHRTEEFISKKLRFQVMRQPLYISRKQLEKEFHNGRPLRARGKFWEIRPRLCPRILLLLPLPHLLT